MISYTNICVFLNIQKWHMNIQREKTIACRKKDKFIILIGNVKLQAFIEKVKGETKVLDEHKYIIDRNSRLLSNEIERFGSKNVQTSKFSASTRM